MTKQLSTERPGGRIVQSLLWVLLVVLLAGIAAAWGWQWHRAQTAAQAALPVYGTVGEFRLTERSGQAWGLSELRGRPWIVNFFFASCTQVCPRTMPQMARLQQTVGEEVRLVSITVDPEHDTPAALTDFARRLGAQPGRWYFLTGDRQSIYDLSLNTFYIAVEEVPEGLHQNIGDAFLHGAHVVLVDQQAQIRGYYDALDDEAMARLTQDAQRLLR